MYAIRSYYAHKHRAGDDAVTDVEAAEPVYLCNGLDVIEVEPVSGVEGDAYVPGDLAGGVHTRYG